MHKIHFAILITYLSTYPVVAQAQSHATPLPSERQMHGESAAMREELQVDVYDLDSPPLPTGKNLDEVLDYAEGNPPSHFPPAVMDNDVYIFTLLEQLEYRIAGDSGSDEYGWETQGWIGTDFNKFWWKSEGEVVFEGMDEGETENDFLYSRLVSPFWNLQLGVQYANEWKSSSYEDRWSAVLAFQGLLPYKFELDNSFYLSEDADVTLSTEVEYNILITQRLVLQPRAELGFAAQDVRERELGAGMTDANLDMRLRYDIKRGLAPYVGVRYRFLVGETKNIAEASAQETEQWSFLAGLRLAF